MTRIAFQTAARAGAMTLLDDYCAAASLKSQRYRARPKSVQPPTFYVESINEVLTPYTVEERQRMLRVIVRVLWGRFDDGDAVDARDKFMDGFLDFVADRPRAFGANTDLNAVAVSDTPDFPFDGESFYASAIALEGFAST